MATQLEFEELYVVSDLHVGDTKGSPIFAQTEELATLVRWLARRSAPHGGGIGLVLNGDVLDTLPEAMRGYVCSPDEAELVVGGILTHPSFADVFTALGEFCSVAGHKLVVVLGNHDLELVYPNVQELFLQRLGAKERELIRARVVFATAGTGFRCLVGKTPAEAVSVACVHGNEFDAWNAFDLDHVAQLIRSGTFGYDSPRVLESPNAGTRLVRDVMNGIKADFPFVDLLKPEMEGVFTILLALAPDRVEAIPEVMRNMTAAQAGGGRRVANVLGRNADGTVPSGTYPEPIWTPKHRFAGFLGNGDNDRLSRAWVQALDGSTTPEQLAERGEVLGAVQLAGNLVGYWLRKVTQSPKDALRAALLDWGGSPETFSLDGPCEVFEGIAKWKPNVDIVIAGHTHLRRQKFLPSSGAQSRAPLYLNTGTWIRLMRLRPEDFELPRFDDVYDALKAKSMQALDALGPGTLLKERTVAVVRPATEWLGVEAAVCELSMDIANRGGPPSDAENACVPVKAWEKVKRG